VYRLSGRWCGCTKQVVLWTLVVGILASDDVASVLRWRSVWLDQGRNGYLVGDGRVLVKWNVSRMGDCIT